MFDIFPSADRCRFGARLRLPLRSLLELVELFTPDAVVDAL